MYQSLGVELFDDVIVSKSIRSLQQGSVYQSLGVELHYEEGTLPLILSGMEIR